VLFYSNKIFYQRTKAILLGIAINCVVINLIPIVVYFLQFDKRKFDWPNPLEDEIYLEYEKQLILKDSLVSSLPSNKVLLNTGKDTVSFYIFNDSATVETITSNLSDFIKKDFKYTTGIMKEIIRLDTVAKHLRFDRNKQLLDSINIYLYAVFSDSKKPLDTSSAESIKSRKTLVIENGSVFGKIYIGTVDTFVIYAYLKAASATNAYLSAANVAEYPLYFFSLLFYPASLVVSEETEILL
jgi:hypothetical protein